MAGSTGGGGGFTDRVVECVARASELWGERLHGLLIGGSYRRGNGLRGAHPECRGLDALCGETRFCANLGLRSHPEKWLPIS